MKVLIAVLLFTAGIFAQYKTVAIDSASTYSDSINIGYNRVVSISVGTSWTTANITFQKWDYALGDWYTIKDKDGGTITLTITSPPANYGLKPVDSWLLTGILRFVSTATQTDTRTLSYELGRLE